MRAAKARKGEKRRRGPVPAAAGSDPRGAGGPVKAKKELPLVENEDLIPRTLLSAFWHRGRPTFRSHRDVADDVEIHVPAVRILLDEAFRRGWFYIILMPPRERANVVRLEDALKRKFGLQKVILVPGFNEMLDNLSRESRRDLHGHVVRAMAMRVAEHLDSLILQAELSGQGFTLGVAWGRTMKRIADYLGSFTREIRLPGLQVLPIVGITSETLSEPIEANIIAMNIAGCFGGSSSQLRSSAFVHSMYSGTVMQEREVVRFLKRIEGCNAVLTSMGAIVDGEDMTISSDAQMNAELVKAALQAGASAEICGWLFDRNGNEVKSAYESIGLGFKGLQRIAADPARQVILVVGGDRLRVEPLRAALRARLASVLVSDTITARCLLGELKG